MNVEKESGSIAQGISDYASFEMLQKGKLHNYWKVIKPLSIFLVQLLDIERDYSLSGALSFKHTN